MTDELLHGIDDPEERWKRIRTSEIPLRYETEIKWWYDQLREARRKLAEMRGIAWDVNDRNNTIRELKAQLATDRAAREKAEAELDETNVLLGELEAWTEGTATLRDAIQTVVAKLRESEKAEAELARVTRERDLKIDLREVEETETQRRRAETAEARAGRFMELVESQAKKRCFKNHKNHQNDPRQGPQCLSPWCLPCRARAALEET